MTTRRLVLVATVVALIVVCAKQATSDRKSEWLGLTESEVRAKLDAKLPAQIADDQRSAISDKVVAKMRRRGVLSEDPAAVLTETGDPGSM